MSRKSGIFFPFFLAFFCSSLIAADWPAPVLLRDTDNTEFYSIAQSAWIIEDKDHELSLEKVRKHSGDSLQFTRIASDNANLDFTSSTWWVVFTVRNEDAFPKKFFLETARPLTNRAHLYTVFKNGLTVESKNGDEFIFDQREVQHRKIMFPVQFQPKEELTFYLKLRSDGEVISLPIKLWHPETLMQKDYHEQYMFGFYYGILVFVIIIYFFFYIALREKSFLYYVLYVFFIALLQMSLDGLSFQYLWPSYPWWGNHIVVISATLTAIFVLLYAKSFLKLSHHLPDYNRIFNFFIVLCLLNLLVTISDGALYAVSFPVTNAISLLSALLVVATIIVSIKRNYPVSGFFTLAFISLISGAIVFILSNFNLVPVTFFTEHSLKFGSALEIILLSLSMANKYREIQQEKELAQAESLKQAKENEKIIREQNIVLEQKVKERTTEVVKQKEIIEEKNKDITDSINYAKGIQHAILPPEEKLKNILPESFILFRPRDIVSGDFYWMSETADTDNVLFAVCDCTGHGVPGGFVSMVSSNSLSRTVNEQGIIQPSLILDRASGIIEQTFSAGKRKDGMDAILCNLDIKQKKLQFSAANNPLYIIRKKSFEVLTLNGKTIEPDIADESHFLFQVNADKQPVGAYEFRKPFTNYEVNLFSGDAIYLSSDGFRDQFGGPKGKKFMAKNFKELLLSLQEKKADEQKAVLNKTIEDWMQGYGQNDDICIIGVKIL